MITTPLRYPGGKSKITALMTEIISSLQMCSTYIEPFAGGAGIAVNLLLQGVVEQIVINDYDKSIYSFWRAVKEDSDRLISLIEEVPVTIEEWHRQREIYKSCLNKYSLELAFATFFLNRTNRSGILSAGPIGGMKQDGEFKLDARFNKRVLINRIENISKHRNAIKVYNKEICSFIENVISKYENDAFVYFDPPYYGNGNRLYKNSFKKDDHLNFAQHVFSYVHIPWVVTYDSIHQIEQIFDSFPIKHYKINYSAAKKCKGSELMIFKNEKLIPSLMR